MTKLDNTEALNSIASSLETIESAISAPASARGGLSTLQELCSQLNEIQGYLHKIDSGIGSIAEAINESALNANDGFHILELKEWFYDLKSATCSIASTLKEKTKKK